MTDPVTMPRQALEAMLEDAAERGAKKALAGVGLGDEDAPEHIRGLRDLFNAYRTVRNGALNEPPRDCRRLFGLSHAASLRSSSMA